MPPLSLKATVTRRQAAEPVDQAVEKAAVRPNDVATDVEPAKSGKALRWESHALQAAFLTGNLGMCISVYTMNGVKLVGRLKQFDQFTLLLEGSDGQPLLIYKHTVTSLSPQRARAGW